jgi:phosphatidylserine decarboxylase
MDDAGGGYRFVIGIYMTPWSVHQNRIPFSGTVVKKVYRESRRNTSMLPALLNLLFRLEPYSEGLEYLVENERCTTVIRGEGMQGAVVQIADKWIRRIVNRCGDGDRVVKGETFGMIRMGSQCDLFLRIDGPCEFAVRERDYVRAGSSILVGVRPRKT